MESDKYLETFTSLYTWTQWTLYKLISYKPSVIFSVS